LDPKSNPAIVKIATKPDNKIFKKKKQFLKISMSGKHMELVHKFLAEYVTMIEAGKQIRSLTKENAQLLAEAKKGQNEMHKEIIQEIADRIYKTDIVKKPKTEEVKEESKELARKDPEEEANE
jgi:sulfur relay (sulfurtransferase) DsrC/TusE family protein